MRRRPPTDLEILEKIYKKYNSDFITFSKDESNRVTKNYVPIDIESIANHFSVDVDIIFGRLYYHLDKKYGFIQADNSKVPFFSREVGSDKNVIHFPLLTSVIASLRENKNKYLVSMWISVAAIIISIVSLISSLII